MPPVHVPSPSRYFHAIGKAERLLSVLAFITIFLSACSPQKNVSFVGKLAFPPASYLLWSPDGNDLAVIGAGGNNQSALYILDVKTKQTRLLLKEDYGSLDAQSWTPDGKRLVLFIIASSDFKQGLWLVDTNGTKSPEFFLDALGAVWSSKGEEVVYRTDFSNTEKSLYISNKNGETNFFSGTGLGISSLSWSFDGSKLVFLFEKDKENVVYIFDAAARKTTQVIAGKNIRSPSLSPNGKMIAYTGSDPKKSLTADYLRIMKSDGSCDTEVPGDFDVYSPTWSPDGKYIAYVGKTDGGIYLLDLVGAFGENIVDKGLPCPGTK